MKKLDLAGGAILRRLLDDYDKEKSTEALGSVFACLRDSEVWVPITLGFSDADMDYSEDTQMPAKKMETYPFYMENDDSGRFLIAYTGLSQRKRFQPNANVIKLTFLECMSWSLSLPKTKGIVLDLETNSFRVYTACFDIIAGMEETAEDEYTYVKVRFSPGGRTYYYEAKREDLTIGDKVIVPFGQYDKEKIGTVVKIEKYNSENLPRSYYSTKVILRKVEEEAAIPRKHIMEKFLLQEQESYDLIKGVIEKENLFSFDAYYNGIFAEEDRYYNPDGDWKEGEVNSKQRQELSKKIENIFDDLDKEKPVLRSNSVGKHYANELFDVPPNRWCYNGDPFLWAYLSRKFSNVLLPLSKEEFTQLFNEFLSFIRFPKEDYKSVKIAKFAYKKRSRAVTRSSVAFILEKLLKNLAKFDEKMAELTKKDTFLVDGKELTTAFGKQVKIKTVKGAVLRGTVAEFSVGNNGFVALNLEMEKGSKEITIDEIAEFCLQENEVAEEETGEGKQYCFVGVSPKGQYGRNYWYVDEEQRSMPGTYVWVGMGRNNKEQIVYVDSVQYCTEHDAPYAIEKTKRILRQATKEESEEAEEDWDY